MTKTIAVYALTGRGAELARNLASGLGVGAILFLPDRLEAEYGDKATYFHTLGRILGDNFNRFDGHLVVGATGMTVRLIAPWLVSKKEDPAVVVMPQDGRFAISLLSGHLGGGNRLALVAAELTGGQAVLSTATDVEGLPALEVLAQELDLRIDDFTKLPGVSRRLVDGEIIPIHDPHQFLSPHLQPWAEHFSSNYVNDQAGVWVDYRLGGEPSAAVVMRPKVIVLGLGCHRGIDLQEVEELIVSSLNQARLAPGAVAMLATVETRAEEPAILELSRRLHLPLKIFTKVELSQVSTPNPSAKVLERIGVASVCEAAAMLAAGTDHLEISKQKSDRATLAAALIKVNTNPGDTYD